MGMVDCNLHAGLPNSRVWAVREKRFPTIAFTNITAERGLAGEAIIHNLSGGGLRISTELPLRLGDRLSLIAEPFGLVQATVQWTLDDQRGLKIVSRDPFHSNYRFAYPP